MAQILFIHGAPGTGKSSLAQALQARLNGPWFEFGWIPEFRQKGEIELTYKEEETFTFDILTLVIKQYVRGGFENIIVSDLRDAKVREIPRRFARFDYRLFTLWMDDEETLKTRVQDETRSSGYRDWEAAVQMNRMIQARPLMQNETRLESLEMSVEMLALVVIKYAAARAPRTLPRRRLPPQSLFVPSEF